MKIDWQSLKVMWVFVQSSSKFFWKGPLLFKMSVGHFSDLKYIPCVMLKSCCCLCKCEAHRCLSKKKPFSLRKENEMILSCHERGLNSEVRDWRRQTHMCIDRKPAGHLSFPSGLDDDYNNCRLLYDAWHATAGWKMGRRCCAARLSAEVMLIQQVVFWLIIVLHSKC